MKDEATKYYNMKMTKIQKFFGMFWFLVFLFSLYCSFFTSYPFRFYSRGILIGLVFSYIVDSIMDNQEKKK